MARQIDSTVLVISVLATFFATFFAALLLFRAVAPETAEPLTAADPSAGATAPVGAGPPDLPSESEAALRERLEQLGVKCADGADC